MTVPVPMLMPMPMCCMRVHVMDMDADIVMNIKINHYRCKTSVFQINRLITSKLKVLMFYRFIASEFLITAEN
jgi:hypothetical protein